jgi:glycosyltransferase involved in cell wall biosynthesis
MQRNIGILRASSPYVFLCDDDIELPPDYVSTLMRFLQQNKNAGAVTGIILEGNNQGDFVSQFPAISFKQLLWNFIFQLTVWADLDGIKPSRMNFIPLLLIKKFYQRRGNTFTLAGWPLVTQFSSPAFQTSIYGLGASIIRRDLLLQSHFDEILDSHGIGDNYGVAINFPPKTALTVLTQVCALHHKISDNRLPHDLAYFRRILALHYFMVKSQRFNFVNRLFLVWSLLGNWLAQAIRKDKTMCLATGKALKAIVFGKNPYVLASRRKTGMGHRCQASIQNSPPLLRREGETLG